MLCHPSIAGWQYTALTYSFSYLNQSDVPCPVLTVASWPVYRCLKRQVRWSYNSHLFQNFPQLIVIHTVKGFGIVNNAEVDVFLELSCFFNDPADVGNLISGSSTFSKTSLNIWKFTVHVLLEPGLANFKHYFTSMWDECNFALLWIRKTNRRRRRKEGRKTGVSQSDV